MREAKWYPKTLRLQCSQAETLSKKLHTPGKAYGNFVLQARLPGAKKPQWVVASTFLGKRASITAVGPVEN